MKKIQTEILIIGGGATGTGIVRDAAMRGFKTILVEMGDLATGTTGRYHGLLHSGGRYVIKDPQAAKECIEENRILRRIMSHCLEDTGGMFVVTPWDDPSYAEKFLNGCKTVGIPVEEISINQMLREEPLLNPMISRCFYVPDGSADSWLAALSNCESAIQYGGEIYTYFRVLHLIENKNNIVGAMCIDLAKDEKVEIIADMTINAAGAWAGKITASVGIEVPVIPGKGTMIATNHRIVNTVINRCKLPSDGDILVPAHTVSVMGTTDIKVSDPDHYSIEPKEIQLLLDEGDKLIPGFKKMRILRAWAGVRPLYQEDVPFVTLDDTRDISRSFVLLDHEKRDGKNGLITITGGKWTTYRKMAQLSVDLACLKLGVQRPCRTHVEPLPKAKNKKTQHLGHRLGEIEKDKLYGRLICECELATYDDVMNSILKNDIKSIDDVRRDVRLGMGPCQGGFCTFRITGLLHKFKKQPINIINTSMLNFLDERWKGVKPILWGQQAKQERLNELIYKIILNTDHLIFHDDETFASIPYTQPTEEFTVKQKARSIEINQEKNQPIQIRTDEDVLIIGAGLAGLMCAYQLVEAAVNTKIITKGWGATYWSTGCIDVVGYDKNDRSRPVNSPEKAISEMIKTQPNHPYALVGLEIITEALEAFKKLCARANYPIYGTLENNWLLPTAIGSIRPTCLAPESMIAGDLKNHEDPMLLIGFENYHDFFPELVATNLRSYGFRAESLSIDLISLHQRRYINSLILSDLFSDPTFREEVANAIRPYIGKAKRIGFPAVIGLLNSLEAKKDLENRIGIPIFEIPVIPPSIPGIRLQQIILQKILENGGEVINGVEVVSSSIKDQTIKSVISLAASRNNNHYAKNFVLATGGILGGGFHLDYEDGLHEIIFDLPIIFPQSINDWYGERFLSVSGHPIFSCGINANKELKPINKNGEPIYKNLFVAGNLFNDYDGITERSFEGVALVTGYCVAKQLSKILG